MALAALRGDRTRAELGEPFGVHPNQVQLWKNRLECQATKIFRKGNGAGKDRWAEIKELLANIGQLTMERDFLSEKLGR